MTIEVSAKKVDDAIKQGLEQLGATLDDVKVEVVDSGGFLRKAKVRLTLETEETAPEKSPAKEEKPTAKQEPAAEKSAPAKKASEQKPVAEKKSEKSTPQKAKSGGATTKVKSKNGEAPAEKADVSPAPSAQEKPEGEQPQKAPAPKKQQKAKSPKKEEVKEQPAPTAGEEQAPSSVEAAESSAHKGKRRLRAEDREAADHALEFVKKTVELMGFSTATVTADEDVEHIDITAEGGDDSLIIGRHGETLSALTYLAETCARAEKCHVNILVDCNGYRARRAASLTAMAKRRARESAKGHRRIKLEPMDRTDRRTIHCALADDAYVTTASEGKEPYRYVVITPKDGEVRDYDEGKRDKGGKRRGKDKRGSAPSAPAGEKPRRAAFDINIHGFVGHNDRAAEENAEVEEKSDE
ncbi:MAG: KH domain-containing protein [Clostridiales bacterium]|nr:KH domain-containing protein [Clostridiales bacterium]